ncbi:MAG: hypothetical protein VKI83_03105 [Synechococcaceae cyanobacterium]|nr:hypothetical protein [Synechococcaceae cyanobacterium]
MRLPRHRFTTLLVVALTSLAAPAAQAAGCRVTKQFQGEAPAAIVEQAFAQKFKQPVNRVDCRDNGLCYQTWGRECDP